MFDLAENNSLQPGGWDILKWPKNGLPARRNRQGFWATLLNEPNLSFTLAFKGIKVR